MKKLFAKYKLSNLLKRKIIENRIKSNQSDQTSLNEAISNTLNELEIQSNLEKTRKVDVEPSDRMLAITKETGEMLNMILRMKNAKNMLEIGMSVGYSTIWCGEAIKENSGTITSIEQNPDKIVRAKENFQKSGLKDTIRIKEGIATDILEKMKSVEENNEYFDCVLIDADKENVIKYFDLVLPMVKLGGVIITDNMLYPEKYRQDMKKFSDYLKIHSQVKTTTSTIGNGEEITIKVR